MRCPCGQQRICAGSEKDGSSLRINHVMYAHYGSTKGIRELSSVQQGPIDRPENSYLGVLELQRARKLKQRPSPPRVHLRHGQQGSRRALAESH